MAIRGFVRPMAGVFAIMNVLKQVSNLFGSASSAEMAHFSFKYNLCKIKFSKTFISLNL